MDLDSIIANIFSGVAVAVIGFIGGFIYKSKLFQRLSRRSLRIDEQESLYEMLIEEVLRNPTDFKEVVFIQHSGHIVTRDICRLLYNNVNVVLYQQDPHIAMLANSPMLIDRITHVPDNILIQEQAKRFNGRLVIRRFKATACLRALMVDDKAIVVSWYLYRLENGNVKMCGSENMGVLVRQNAPEFELLSGMVKHVRTALDAEQYGCNEKSFSNSNNIFLVE